jgi:hypothetical protein
MSPQSRGKAMLDDNVLHDRGAGIIDKDITEQIAISSLDHAIMLWAPLMTRWISKDKRCGCLLVDT